MKKLFVPYDIVILLEALGFSEPCFAFCTDGNQEPFMVDDDYEYKYTGFRTCHRLEVPQNYHPLPIYQQVIDWFQTKGVMIWITPHPFSSSGGWSYNILYYIEGVLKFNRADAASSVSLSREEALNEAFIQSCKIIQK